jgi:hypothetical protein
MPTSVKELFDTSGVQLVGRVNWGQQIKDDRPGIYIVAVTSQPDGKKNLYGKVPPIDIPIIQKWINDVQTLRLDRVRPNSKELQQRLCRFWLPDEPILYVGKAGKSVKERVSAYYNTPLGKRKPHGGGHWIKTLSEINKLSVFWGACNDPENTENIMLKRFVDNVSSMTKKVIHDPDRPFPFANREFPHGNKKRHGISGAVNRD